MPDSTLALNFNDIALIRALSQIGKDCERKIGKLVDSAIEHLKKSSIGVGDVKKFDRLFKSDTCSGGYRFLETGLTKDGDPMVTVAFGSEQSVDYFGIYLEVPTAYAKRASVRKAVTDSLTKIQKRDSDWDILDEGEGRYIALENWVPLTDLLAASDQTKFVEEFLTAKIEDLQASGAVDAVIAAFKKK